MLLLHPMSDNMTKVIKFIITMHGPIFSINGFHQWLLFFCSYFSKIKSNYITQISHHIYTFCASSYLDLPPFLRTPYCYTSLLNTEHIIILVLYMCMRSDPNVLCLSINLVNVNLWIMFVCDSNIVFSKFKVFDCSQYVFFMFVSESTYCMTNENPKLIHQPVIEF